MPRLLGLGARLGKLLRPKAAAFIGVTSLQQNVDQKLSQIWLNSDRSRTKSSSNRISRTLWPAFSRKAAKLSSKFFSAVRRKGSRGRRIFPEATGSRRS